MLNKARRLWARFSDDEHGSGTIWALFWLILCIGIGGLAVDVTNAQRVETLMQATADAIVHDAALDLPDESAATSSALATAAFHMPAETYGEVLVAADLEFGIWDPETRMLVPTGIGEIANAVRANLSVSTARGNPLATMLLKVTGFDVWEIGATATALLDWEKCYLDGLISASRVVMDSSNVYKDNFCVYGRNGVQLVNENDFTGDFNHAYVGYSTSVTHECGFFLMGTKGAPPDCSMNSNPGLAQAKFVSDKVYPERLYQMGADGTPELDVNGNPIITLSQQIQALVTQTKEKNYLLEPGWRGSGNQPLEAVTSKLKGGGFFYLECANDNTVLELNGGNYKNLVLVTNCLLELPGGSPSNPNIYENVIFASTSTASFKDTGVWRNFNHNIAVRGGNILGVDCAANKGAQFLTMSGVKFDGGNMHKGNKITVGGGVGIDGSNDASSTAGGSISVHALGDIVMTSTNKYSLCDRSGEWTGIVKYPVLVN